MKNTFLLITLALLVFCNTVNAQGYSYYNSSQYRYNNSVYQYNLYNSQINSYKPAGYGTYSTPNSSGSYGSYNHNSYTPSYNYNSNSYTPSYNSYYDSYSSNTESNHERGRKEDIRSYHYEYAKVVFCEKVDENGNPIGVYDNFTLSPSGGVVYTQISNSSIKTQGLKVNIYLNNVLKETIEPLLNSGFYKNTADNKAWFSYDYAKYGSGNYRLEIYSLGGWAAIKTVNVQIKGTGSSANSTVTASHYANAKAVFCEDVDANWNPVGVHSSFTISPGKGVVKMFVEVPGNLKTTAITANIYSGYTFKDSQTYTFNADAVNSPKAAMSYDFSKLGPGYYTVDFKSKEGVLIKSASVTINDKTTANTQSQYSQQANNYTGNTSSSTTVTGSDYYKMSNIYFFEDKADFDLAGSGRNSLYLNLSSNTAYIEVTNDKALNTSKLMVSIEKKDSKGTYQPYDKKEFPYDDLYSKSFYFTYNFKEAGDYRFDIKSKEGFWINADYVSVYRK